jgi:NAD(P)-dependent dehydrogenase (short-subunit alcohol dehydrogenase family)
MSKTILITGSTDGIGLATAKALIELGHNVLLHGRSAEKLEQTKQQLSSLSKNGKVHGYLADFSNLAQVAKLAKTIADKHGKLDVLINNAGVFKVPHATTLGGFDVRFLVNTVAPFLLTQKLLPLMGPKGRVVNLSSAALAPVQIDALAGRKAPEDDFAAYAQSKLALTMWSQQLGDSLGANGPVIIAINPGSMLATKMVKEGFDTEGSDIGIAVEVLVSASLSDDFESATGLYFDNDTGYFDAPHVDALDPQKRKNVVSVIEGILVDLL